MFVDNFPSPYGYPHTFTAFTAIVESYLSVQTYWFAPFDPVLSYKYAVSPLHESIYEKSAVILS